MHHRLTGLFLVVFLSTLCGCDDSSGKSGPDGGADGGSDSGAADAGDTTAPVPGATGTLVASNPTSSSVELAWTAATDDATAAAQLEYRVYYSLADDLDTVANVLAHGTAATDWQAALTSTTVQSLSLETGYHFNVLVRDASGNVAVYGGATQATLAGTWQPEEGIEDYTGGSVYYSRISVSSKGDTAVRWDFPPTWEAHYVVRGADATTFGSPLPWGDVGTYTPRIEYDSGDHLAGATIVHGTSTDDLVFQRDPGTGSLTSETVASGLPQNSVDQFRSCFAQNGDVMVVWLEGAGSGAVRARLRTGGTWGTTSLVTPAEGLDVYGLEVACRPNGNHVVLYGQYGTPAALYARVWNAAGGDWQAPAAPLGTLEYQSGVDTARTSAGTVVVAWREYDSGTSTTYYRARLHDGSAWSATTETLASSDTVSLNGFWLASAGSAVQAIWAVGTQLSTSRFAGGSWSSATPLGDPLTGLSEARASGDPAGDVLFAWVDSAGVQARMYAPGTGTWGATVTLGPTGNGIAYGSLAAALDPRRRATVVWTVWDPTASTFSAVARTYR